MWIIKHDTYEQSLIKLRYPLDRTLIYKDDSKPININKPDNIKPNLDLYVEPVKNDKSNLIKECISYPTTEINKTDNKIFNFRREKLDRID